MDQLERPIANHVHIWFDAPVADVLASYGLDPEAIEIGPHGKPVVPNGELQFNRSDSGSSSVVAVGLSPVGVDLELLDPRRDVESIARRYFTSGELERLGLDEDRKQSFYEIWTTKEAILKGTGKGLRDLESYDSEGWTLARLDAPPGYVGHVALAANSITLEYVCAAG